MLLIYKGVGRVKTYFSRESPETGVPWVSVKAIGLRREHVVKMMWQRGLSIVNNYSSSNRGAVEKCCSRDYWKDGSREKPRVECGSE